MRVVETVLGNIETDPDLEASYEERPAEEIEEVVLDEQERRRSRFRTATDAGTELGVVVESDRGLRPGDVLVNDEERFIVVAFADREALVVTFEAPEDEAAMAAAAQLGYRVGNRHLDLAVRDGAVLIALGNDGDRVAETVTAALPSGAETHREYVDPTLFDGTPAHGHGESGHTHGDGLQPVGGETLADIRATMETEETDE
jgi:urease accessory protein